MPRPLRVSLLAIPALLILATIGVWTWNTFRSKSTADRVEVKTQVVQGITFEVEYRHEEGWNLTTSSTPDSVVFDRRGDFLDFENGVMVWNGIGFPGPKPGDVVRWNLEGPILVNGQPIAPHPLQPRPLPSQGTDLRFGSPDASSDGRDTLTIGWSGNSRAVVTASRHGVVRVWTPGDPRPDTILVHPEPESRTPAGHGVIATISPNGKMVVTGYRGGAVAVPWDVASSGAEWPLTGPTGNLRGLQFLTDDWLLEVRGERLLARNLAGDREKTTDLGKVADRLAPPFTVSADGSTLAAWDGTNVVVSRLMVGKDAITATPAATVPVPGVEALALTADGKRLAVGHELDRLSVYEPGTAVPSKRLRVRRPAQITSLAFAPDGATLAVGTTDSLRLYDMATTRECGQIALPWVRALAYSPNGTFLAVALRYDADGGARLWATTELHAKE